METRWKLICPGPLVAESGTAGAASQSLPPFEDRLILTRKMRTWTCGTVFMRACSSWVDHSGAPSLGPSSPSVFGETPKLYFLHTAPNVGRCLFPSRFVNYPRGWRHQHPGPVPSAARKSGQLQKPRVALASFHLCPHRPMTVSPCLAAKWDCVELSILGAQRPLVKSSRFGPRRLAPSPVLQVVSNSICRPNRRQPRLDL